MRCLWKGIDNLLFKLCQGRSRLDVLLLTRTSKAREHSFSDQFEEVQLTVWFFALLLARFPQFLRLVTDLACPQASLRKSLQMASAHAQGKRRNDRIEHENNERGF